MTPQGDTSVVELGRSPGGKEENTGNTSAFSDKLMMGIVEVISTNPVKLCRLSRGPRLAAPCAKGPSCMFALPSRAPAELITVSVIVADSLVEGFA
jgi:hypothetical protein